MKAMIALNNPPVKFKKSISLILVKEIKKHTKAKESLTQVK
jgi:hypothetical protein